MAVNRILFINTFIHNFNDDDDDDHDDDDLIPRTLPPAQLWSRFGEVNLANADADADDDNDNDDEDDDDNSVADNADDAMMM